MERPQANIERPLDEYDHELTQLQTDAIALADELLKLKEEGSSWSFVDIVFEGDRSEMLEEIESGPLVSLLYAPNEQMAIESDGSYYPTLDVRKENGQLQGIGLRVWGWDYEKTRRIPSRDQNPSYDYKTYPGEVDKTREIEIAMSYKVGKEHVTEMLKLYVNAARPDYIYISSQLSMPTYAETGYEGHGGKSDDIDEEGMYWLLDFVARHVGDEPKSIAQLQRERVMSIRREAENN
ncbi:hypothetical protein KDA14_05555, partial [Candidatus Saccharibacteria bacterium]|nr:hypothetical protein [Candidatus Saccharibacteria bacterium]